MSRRSLLAGCFAALYMASTFTATAAAETTIELTVGTEPVESITTQLGARVSGAESGDDVWLVTKPTGGERCATNPQADRGNSISEDLVSTEGGTFTSSHNYNYEKAGAYLLCGWVTRGSGENVLAHAETTLSVRLPHLALSVSAPASVAIEQAFQLVTTAQAETSRAAWEYLLPNTGDGCPANAAAADSASAAEEVFGDWQVVGGPVSQTRNESLASPGAYLVCAYFEYPGRESPPELAASAPLVVLAPPPPCVVPSLVSHASLASVEQSIQAASCTVGKVSHAASTTVPRGDVISLGQTSGAKLAHGAAIAILVSAGRPCIVPYVKRSTGLKKAERQLAGADCTAAISYVRSRRVPRDRVVGLGVRAYTRLSPRARVRLLVSSGRGRG